jgi:hypothetical protein
VKSVRKCDACQFVNSNTQAAAVAVMKTTSLLLISFLLLASSASFVRSALFVKQCIESCNRLSMGDVRGCCISYGFESGWCDPIPHRNAAFPKIHWNSFCFGGQSQDRILHCDKSNATLANDLADLYRDAYCDAKWEVYK